MTPVSYPLTIAEANPADVLTNGLVLLPIPPISTESVVTSCSSFETRPVSAEMALSAFVTRPSRVVSRVDVVTN